MIMHVIIMKTLFTELLYNIYYALVARLSSF